MTYRSVIKHALTVYYADSRDPNGLVEQLLAKYDADVRAATPDLPSRFHATPVEVDAYLRTILAEDAYLRFQQAIGEHAIAQTVEDTDAVRAAADNEGLYNNDWREGWDDYRDRVDPDQNDPYPVKLVDFPDA